MKDHRNAHMAVNPTTGKGAPSCSAPKLKSHQGTMVASEPNKGMKKQLAAGMSNKVKTYS